jgi:hypothetical protein
MKINVKDTAIVDLVVESDDIRIVGEEYVKHAVVINCAGVISPVESEERARYLAEEAHADAGWSWGILLQRRMPPRERKVLALPYPLSGD